MGAFFSNHFQRYCAFLCHLFPVRPEVRCPGWVNSPVTWRAVPLGWLSGCGSPGKTPVRVTKFSRAGVGQRVLGLGHLSGHTHGRKKGICCELRWTFCLGTALLLLWLLYEQAGPELVFQGGGWSRAFAALTRYLRAAGSLSSAHQAVCLFSMASWNH